MFNNKVNRYLPIDIVHEVSCLKLFPKVSSHTSNMMCIDFLSSSLLIRVLKELLKVLLFYVILKKVESIMLTIARQ